MRICHYSIKLLNITVANQLRMNQPEQTLGIYTAV